MPTQAHRILALVLPADDGPARHALQLDARTRIVRLDPIAPAPPGGSARFWVTVPVDHDPLEFRRVRKDVEEVLRAASIPFGT